MSPSQHRNRSRWLLRARSATKSASGFSPEPMSSMPGWRPSSAITPKRDTDSFDRIGRPRIGVPYRNDPGPGPVDAVASPTPIARTLHIDLLDDLAYRAVDRFDVPVLPHRDHRPEGGNV